MSLITIEQVLCDSEKLAVRLQEDDNAADDLLSQARCVYKQIDAMKQYSEETMELNELARQRPHSVLVAGIQQESRHLRELQQENRELRAALEDHQNALEVIMSKYRQHVAHLVQASRPTSIPELQLNNQYAQLKRQSDKMNEMAAVMRMAAQTDEKDSLQDIEVISKLATENQGLRELLNISVKYGSYKQKKESTNDNKQDNENADKDDKNLDKHDKNKDDDDDDDDKNSRISIDSNEAKQSSDATQSSPEQAPLKKASEADSSSKTADVSNTSSVTTKATSSSEKITPRTNEQDSES